MGFPQNLPTQNNNGIAIVRALEYLYDTLPTTTNSEIKGFATFDADPQTAMDSLATNIESYVTGSTYYSISGTGLAYDAGGGIYAVTAIVTKWS